METEFSIQQVAERMGLSIDTLRYYERIGLLELVSRASSGHRCYSQKDIDWIGMIINSRETRMPLAQIRSFAELHRQGEVTALPLPFLPLPERMGCLYGELRRNPRL